MPQEESMPEKEREPLEQKAAGAAEAPKDAETLDNPETSRKSRIKRADAIKLAGLLACLGIMFVIVALLWPYLGRLFEPGGVDQLVEQVKNAGPLGVLVLLGMQFLQVIVAFIPGEVVQVAAGMIYGPWFGALILLVGCYFSMWIIFELVHRLGRPFVQDMVSADWLEKFDRFEESGKLDGIVFILFLIPGLPKDTFSYLVPLTSMPRQRYLVLANIARIPGILASTFAASGLVAGDVASSVAIFAVLGLIAVLAIVFREKLLGLLHRGEDDVGE